LELEPSDLNPILMRYLGSAYVHVHVCVCGGGREHACVFIAQYLYNVHAAT